MKIQQAHYKCFIHTHTLTKKQPIFNLNYLNNTRIRYTYIQQFLLTINSSGASLPFVIRVTRNERNKGFMNLPEIIPLQTIIPILIPYSKHANLINPNINDNNDYYHSILIPKHNPTLVATLPLL